MPSLFIGMPAYNGERFIRQAIDSIRNQSFENWKLLISIDVSTDNTEKICKEYSSLDPRITYVSQVQRLNYPDNFKYVLQRANGDYFMWAADDDVWYPEFIETCLQLLEQNKQCSLAFTNFVNTDTYGNVIRTYPDLSRFTSFNRLVNVYRCLLEPEILGKSILIYAIYRMEAIKSVWNRVPFTLHWGFDNCFSLGALAHFNLAINKKVLFQKRFSRPSDNPSKVNVLLIEKPYIHVFPLISTHTYLIDTLKAVKDTNFFLIALVIMLLRSLRLFVTSSIPTLDIILKKRRRQKI